MTGANGSGKVRSGADLRPSADVRSLDEARSLADLVARLDTLEARVRRLVATRRLDDANADDPFRGIYLSDDAIDRVLEAAPALTGRGADVREAGADPTASGLARDADPAADSDLRLGRLAVAFGLDPVDLDLLVVALAPDLDRRFEQLYGYLNDDVTRRRASIGLALELSGLDALIGTDRAHISAAGPLLAGGLLQVEEPERPILTRSLRVPDRVIAYVLGDDAPEPEIAALLERWTEADPALAAPTLARALVDGDRFAYIHQGPMTSGIAMATDAAAAAGRPALVLALDRLARQRGRLELASTVAREARLTGSILVAGPVDALATDGTDVIARLADAGGPVVLVGERPWDPAWARAVPLLLEAARPSAVARRRRWELALEQGAHDDATLSRGHDALFDAVRSFHLTAPQVERAAATARLLAGAAGRELTPADLQAGARSQNASGLERLAHRVSPVAGWADLVLPGHVTTQLRELAGRVRHRDRVLDEWRVGDRSSRGRGITALFGGESGTGKTLAAEVIAGALGLDLYVIDLATIVDKYIGETEKNLDRVFAEADRANGVLLFDEADAIFGKRSEVRDARDRYANVEVAYLLQRMERFDGLAILTTNLRANLDESFTRRLDVIVDFPSPEEDARLALWRMHLPPHVPQSSDLDLAFMASRFRLAGGNIRNICLTAAFLAADDGGMVTMGHLVRATEREYRKLGRLTLEAEFGQYHALLEAAAT
jgi:hypothetical protein